MSQHVDPAEPTHVDRETLIAYAMDEQTLDAAAIQHLGQCPECSAEIAWWRSLERAVATNRDRQSCPSVESLQAYALNQLTGATKRTVEAHIKGCVQCAAEVSASREFLLAGAAAGQSQSEGILAAVADALSDTARRVLASLLPEPSAQHAYQPAISTRGGTPQDMETPQDTEDVPGEVTSPPTVGSQQSPDAEREAWTHEAQPRIYGAEDVEISLRPRLERGKYFVTGSVSVGEHARVGEPIAARLLQTSMTAEGCEQVAPIEAPIEYDAFELGPVPPGVYTIEVLFADRLLEIAALDLQVP